MPQFRASCSQHAVRRSSPASTSRCVWLPEVEAPRSWPAGIVDGNAVLRSECPRKRQSIVDFPKHYSVRDQKRVKSSPFGDNGFHRVFSDGRSIRTRKSVFYERCDNLLRRTRSKDVRWKPASIHPLFRKEGNDGVSPRCEDAMEFSASGMSDFQKYTVLAVQTFVNSPALNGSS